MKTLLPSICANEPDFSDALCMECFSCNQFNQRAEDHAEYQWFFCSILRAKLCILLYHLL